MPRNWAQQVSGRIFEIRRGRTGAATSLGALATSTRCGSARSPTTGAACRDAATRKGVRGGKFVPEAEGGLFGELNRVYLQIADDRSHGRLPTQVSESLIRKRYDLTRAQTAAVLGRIAQEGWVERRPGYGWEFSEMLTTPEALLQTYRARMALEPAALLEPGYRLEPAVIERLRATEVELLDGALETISPDALHERGVRFHESIVGASRNPFFLDALRRINRVRRLLSYRSMATRDRYQQQCREHLDILGLLEQNRNAEAAEALRAHLVTTIRNLDRIRPLMEG